MFSDQARADSAADSARESEPATLDAIQEELSYGIGSVGNLEADPRDLPWATLRRLALEVKLP